MALPLPMNKPVPIAPPRPIITTWERVKACWSPRSRSSLCVTASPDVFVAQDLREQQRIEIPAGHDCTHVPELMSIRERRRDRNRSRALRYDFVGYCQQFDRRDDFVQRDGEDAVDQATRQRPHFRKHGTKADSRDESRIAVGLDRAPGFARRLEWMRSVQLAHDDLGGAARNTQAIGDPAC